MQHLQSSTSQLLLPTDGFSRTMMVFQTSQKGLPARQAVHVEVAHLASLKVVGIVVQPFVTTVDSFAILHKRETKHGSCSLNPATIGCPTDVIPTNNTLN